MKPMEGTVLDRGYSQLSFSPSDFQPVCHKNFKDMQYLTIKSGALTSFPLDCQIKQMATANTAKAVWCE